MSKTNCHSDLDRLVSLSKATAYKELAQEAKHLAESVDSGNLLRGTACALWAYSLVRIDPHRHQDQARRLAGQAMELLPPVRSEDPETVDFAMIALGMAAQLLGDHSSAVSTFERVMSASNADLSNRVKAGFSRAFSLHTLGRQPEALATYLDLARQLDALPKAELTLSLNRERQRTRLNVADHYLNEGDHEAAEAELNQLDEQYITPLMNASRLVSQARIAMLRDQWREAEEVANRAYSAALEVNYTPLRVDALGVLVAAAARNNRQEEQLRLVVEMASLAQAK